MLKTVLLTRDFYFGVRCKRFYDGELPPPTCDLCVLFGQADGRNWRFPSVLVLFIDACDVNCLNISIFKSLLPKGALLFHP